MVYLRNRTTVKFVGWIDLVLLIIGIVCTVLFAAFVGPIFELLGRQGNAFFSSIIINNETLNGTELSSDFAHYAKVLWIETGIGIVCDIIQIIAAILLINSTSYTREPQSALKLAFFWMMVNVTVMVVYFIWRAITGSWFSLVVGVVIRGAFIFFVVLFFQELRNVTRRTPIPAGLDSSTANITTEMEPTAPPPEPVDENTEQKY